MKAKVLAHELGDFHVIFIEELILPEQGETPREIASHTSILIATGALPFSRWDFKQRLCEG